MSTSSDNNKRIAKNTMMLYIRMAITMLVQLYTSRVVLEVLGVSDFGLWNLVASVIVSISFITGPLTIATQRFLSFELGKKDKSKVASVFSQSMLLYIIFGIIIIITLETIGTWFLNNKLQIPADRTYIANIVFQLSIISFVFTMLRMPYDATIIAHEKMNFYAYMSIVDVFLKLGIVYLLLVIKSVPHLVVYGILTLFVNILIVIIYKLYCNKKYPNVTKLKLTIESNILKSMASFSGWSLLGAFSVMTANQGVNMVLNMFYGVVINATMGITNQVGNAVNQFIGNFQTAFNPQIVKSYASKDESRFTFLILNCCRISYNLIILIAIPLIFNIEPILMFWLGTVPEYLPIFCQLTLLYMIIDAISASINMGIYASGKIKIYQILISLSILMILPFSYIVLYLGCDAYIVILVRLAISIISLFIRVMIINHRVSESVIPQFLRLFPRLILIGLIASLVPYIIMILTDFHWIITVVLDLIWSLTIIYIIGIDKPEKNLILKTIFKRR